MGEHNPASPDGRKFESETPPMDTYASPGFNSDASGTTGTNVSPDKNAIHISPSLRNRESKESLVGNGAVLSAEEQALNDLLWPKDMPTQKAQPPTLQAVPSADSLMESSAASGSPEPGVRGGLVYESGLGAGPEPNGAPAPTLAGSGG